MSSKQKAQFYQLNQHLWIKFLVVVSIVIRQQTTFFINQDQSTQKLFLDWTSIFKLLSAETVIVFSLAIATTVVSQYAYLLIARKYSLMVTVSETILLPILLIFVSKIAQTLTSIQNHFSSRTICVIVIVLASITSFMFYLFRNLHIHIKTLNNNLRQTNYLDKKYFIISTLKFLLCLFFPLLEKQKIYLIIILIPIVCWKIWIMKNQMVFNSIELQYFGFYGEIYSFCSFIKLCMISSSQFDVSLLVVIKYTPIILTSCFICFVFLRQKEPVKLFYLQSKKYHKILSHHIDNLKHTKTKNFHDHKTDFYKEKILIASLLIHKNFHNSEHDFCIELDSELNFLLNKYLKIQFERVKDIQLHRGEVCRGQGENDRIKKRINMTKDSRQLAMTKNNLIFFKSVQFSQKNIDNKNSIVCQNQQNQSVSSQMSRKSHQEFSLTVSLPKIQQIGKSEEYLSQSKRLMNLKKVQQIMTSQQGHVQKEGIALFMTTKFIHQNSVDYFLGNALNSKHIEQQQQGNEQKDVQKLESFYENLWKIFLFDIPESSHDEKHDDHSQINRLKKLLYSQVAFGFLRTNAKPTNIIKSFYILYKAYQNIICEDVLKKSYNKNRIQKWFEKTSFEVNHNELMDKIGNQRFIDAQSKWVEQIPKDKFHYDMLGKSCFKSPQFSQFFSPSFISFVNSHEKVSLLKLKISQIHHFISSKNLFEYVSDSPTENYCTRLMNYYSELHELKKTITQLLEQCDQESFVKSEMKALRLIFDRFVMKNQNEQREGKKLDRKMKVSSFIKQEKIKIETLTEQCVFACSTLNKKNGYIMTQNNQFKKFFNSLPFQNPSQTLHNQTSQLSSQPKPSKSISNINASSLQNNLYGVYNGECYPHSLIDTKTKQKLYHVNNLLLRPFQRDHFNLMDSEKRGGHDVGGMVKSFMYHNQDNLFSQEEILIKPKRQNQGLYCTDFHKRKHFQIKGMKLYLSHLSLQDIYMIVHFPEIQQLEFIQIQQKSSNPVPFTPIRTQPSKKMQLLYRYVHPSVEKEKSEVFGFENQKKVAHKDYFERNIVVYKSVVSNLNLTKISTPQKRFSQEDFESSRLSDPNHNPQQKVYHQLVQPPTTHSLFTHLTSLHRLIILQQICPHLVLSLILVLCLLMMFSLMTAISTYFQSEMQEYLNLRKITHTSFVVNQIFSPIDLMMASAIYKANQMGLISTRNLGKFSSQISISMGLTMQFYRESESDFSLYSQENSFRFYELLFYSYQTSTSTSLQSTSTTAYHSAQLDINDQSFYITYITQLHKLYEMKNLLRYNRTTNQQNQLQNYYLKSLTTLNDFFENSHWHQRIDQHFQSQREYIELIDVGLFWFAVVECLGCLMGIGWGFYRMKIKIWRFLDLPLRANCRLKDKCIKNAKRLKELLSCVQKAIQQNHSFTRQMISTNKKCPKNDQTSSHHSYTPHLSNRQVFYSTSKHQSLLYILLSILILVLIILLSNSRSQMLEKIQMYDKGEEQFMEKLIYSFDMFKILLTNTSTMTEAQKVKLKEQYLQNERIEHTFNYLEFIGKLVDHNQTLRDQMLIEPLCSTKWSTARWYQGCSNPFSALINATYLSFASKASLYMKELKLYRFQKQMDLTHKDSLNLALKTYEALWNLHKIGYEYLNISHEIFNSIVVESDEGKYWQVVLWAVVVVVVAWNFAVYLGRFRVWQHEVFTVATIKDLKQSSVQYAYHISMTERTLYGKL